MHGHELKRWRTQREMTQMDLSVELGVSDRALQMWEAGDREVPEHMAYTLTGIDVEGAVAIPATRWAPGGTPTVEFNLVYGGHGTRFVISHEGLKALAGGRMIDDIEAVNRLFDDCRHRIKLAAIHAIADEQLPIKETITLGEAAFVSKERLALDEVLDALRGTIGFIDVNSGLLAKRAQQHAMAVLEKHRPNWKFS